jgi:hypothetical protein
MAKSAGRSQPLVRMWPGSQHRPPRTRDFGPPFRTPRRQGIGGRRRVSDSYNESPALGWSIVLPMDSQTWGGPSSWGTTSPARARGSVGPRTSIASEVQTNAGYLVSTWNRRRRVARAPGLGGRLCTAAGNVAEHAAARRMFLVSVTCSTRWVSRRRR